MTGGEASLQKRVAALASRRSKSPSHIEEFRSAVVVEVERWTAGFEPNGRRLLEAVEAYDRAKGGSR